MTVSAENPSSANSGATTPRDGKRPGRSRWRKLAFALIALGIASLAALLVGEAAIRVFRPQLLFPRYVTDGGFGIRVNVPNARYWHTSPEMKVQFRINAMGIRSDREYTFAKPEGTIRIVGLGDSFTQGYEVSLEECYLFRLEQMLKEKGYPVEVINLGVSGHGTAEQLIMLREFGLRFDPDVVIVGFYQNDLDDNIRSGLFRVGDDGSLVRAADSYLPAIGIRDRLYAWSVFRWLAENSQLFSLVRENLAGMVKHRMVESKMNDMAGPAADESRSDETEAILAARLLDAIKLECEQRGIAFLLLDIPGYDLSESNLPIRRLSRITPDEIVETGPALRAKGPDAYLYRRQGHRHWTPQAHDLAAHLLAVRLNDLLAQRVQVDPDMPLSDAPRVNVQGTAKVDRIR